MQFLFSVLCIVTYGTIKKLCGTNLCDLRLTRIIHINLVQEFIALGDFFLVVICIKDS